MPNFYNVDWVKSYEKSKKDKVYKIKKTKVNGDDLIRIIKETMTTYPPGSIHRKKMRDQIKKVAALKK